MKSSKFLTVTRIFELMIVVAMLSGPQISNASVQSTISDIPGFQTIKSPAIPEEVKNASASVFRVISYGSFKNIETIALSEALPMLAAHATSQEVDGREAISYKELVQIYGVYLKACQLQGTSVCQIPALDSSPEKGSGVVVGSGKDLFTASHVIEPSVKWALAEHSISTLGELKEKRVLIRSIFVFDAQRNLVAHPLTNPAYIKTSGGHQIESNHGANPIRSSRDYVHLHFEKNVGRPVAVALSVANPNILYSAGFAACTGCKENIAPSQETAALMNFDRSPAPNSTGTELVFTVSSVSSNVDDESAATIESNADGRGGMSGGAIFDAQGELVAILSQAGSYFNLESMKIVNVFTIGVRPHEWGPITGK